MNLQEIKTELSKLTEQIVKLEQEKPAYSFTKEELIKLITAVQNQTLDAINEDIKEMDLTIEDYITLDLYDREIQLDFDNRGFFRDVVGNLDVNGEVTDDDINNLLVDFQK